MELDLAGTQPGVGEKSEGSNEVRCSELDGLSRRGQPAFGQLVVDRNLLKRGLHMYINGFVQDVKVSLHNLQGFVQCLAAEGRIDQQSVIARVTFVRSQIQPEAPVFRSLGGEVEQCGMLMERYAGGFLV